MRLVLIIFFAQFWGISATTVVHVSIAEQSLSVMRDGTPIKKYPVSTSGWGIGNERDSNKTPLGKHRVNAKIGAGAPRGTIFKASINTQRRAQIYHHSVPRDEQKDLITTRIIQLEGLEKQNNNSFKRGIWIHGTPNEGDIGTPCSHGCIRMCNDDIAELFALVTKGTIVNIQY